MLRNPAIHSAASKSHRIGSVLGKQPLIRRPLTFIAALLSMGLAFLAGTFLAPGEPVLSSPPTSSAHHATILNSRGMSLDDLLVLDDSTLNRTDPLVADLAIARTLPGHQSLDVDRYNQTLDDWAAHVRTETERHLYRFHQNPADYKNSLAYFKALALATVVGQDYEITYDLEAVDFGDPRNLFIHGVLDQRRGTCVSLPVLYMALGHRLGYPIRAVTVPRHLFCRWDDPQTGERFNIEAANAGGLTDHPDAYYQTWPTQLDPQDVQTGGALKSLSMREFIGVKLASRGDYYWQKGLRPEAQTSYALAHQLYPACRSIQEILFSQVVEEVERYPWSTVYRVTSRLRGKRLQSDRSVIEQEGSP